MEPNLQEALWKLAQMGIDPGDISADYNKIPLENTDLAKVEREISNPEQLWVAVKQLL